MLLHSTFIIIVIVVIQRSQRIDYLLIKPHFYTSEYILGSWAFGRQIEISSVLSICSPSNKNSVVNVSNFRIGLDVIKIIEIYSWLWCSIIFHIGMQSLWLTEWCDIDFLSCLYVCYALRSTCSHSFQYDFRSARIMSADSVRSISDVLLKILWHSNLFTTLSTFTIK